MEMGYFLGKMALEGRGGRVLLFEGNKKGPHTIGVQPFAAYFVTHLD